MNNTTNEDDSSSSSSDDEIPITTNTRTAMMGPDEVAAQQQRSRTILLFVLLLLMMEPPPPENNSRQQQQYIRGSRGNYNKGMNNKTYEVEPFLNKIPFDRSLNWNSTGEYFGSYKQYNQETFLHNMTVPVNPDDIRVGVTVLDSDTVIFDQIEFLDRIRSKNVKHLNDSTTGSSSHNISPGSIHIRGSSVYNAVEAQAGRINLDPRKATLKLTEFPMRPTGSGGDSSKMTNPRLLQGSIYLSGHPCGRIAVKGVAYSQKINDIVDKGNNNSSLIEINDDDNDANSNIQTTFTLVGGQVFRSLMYVQNKKYKQKNSTNVLEQIDLKDRGVDYFNFSPSPTLAPLILGNPYHSGRNARTYNNPVAGCAFFGNFIGSGSVVNGTLFFKNKQNTDILSINLEKSDLSWDKVVSKALNYSFYMMLMSMMQIAFTLRQILHSSTGSGAKFVSLGMMWSMTSLDAILCVIHILLAIFIDRAFTAFASVAFFKLLIFCIIEMKYMALLAHARVDDQGNRDDIRQREKKLQAKFYTGLAFQLLALYYIHYRYAVLFLYSFWVPQIIYNIKTESKRPLHRHYILCMSFSRLISPFYFFGVKGNFVKEIWPQFPTDYGLCYSLFLWIGFQAIVLLAQSKYGARFMIPARFLPPKFDYSRPIPSSMLQDIESETSGSLDDEDTNYNRSEVEMSSLLPRNSSSISNRINRAASNSTATNTSSTTEVPSRSPTLDCVICYSPIDISNRRGYMLAPCNHIFHRDCLEQWMDVKMECPVCRMALPAV